MWLRILALGQLALSRGVNLTKLAATQIIKSFCGVIGASNKQAQAVIRLAKKNGEKLGFLS